ncbi:MAG: permease, partial [Anaerolineae bacterium]|nr:permease [Anaerolineae bacterium]
MASRINPLQDQKTQQRDFALVVLGVLVWWIIFNNLQPVADFVTYQLLALDPESHLGSAVNFFVYDVPKILLLLSGMIFLITLLRTFITPEQTRRWLGGKREGVGNILAAFVGVITPFCSCSAVPLFIGFVESGLPLGVTFSYLVAAPMVNEVALVMLFGMFGWQVAGLYLLSGLIIAIVAGVVIGRLGMERQVEEFVYQVKVGSKGQMLEDRLTWHERFEQALSSTREIVGKVWLYVVIGIAIGAGIHGFVPDDFLAETLGKDTFWAVPLAVILGVPLYSNAAGIIPVVSV